MCDLFVCALFCLAHSKDRPVPWLSPDWRPRAKSIHNLFVACCCYHYRWLNKRHPTRQPQSSPWALLGFNSRHPHTHTLSMNRSNWELRVSHLYCYAIHSMTRGIQFLGFTWIEAILNGPIHLWYCQVFNNTSLKYAPFVILGLKI